MSVPIVAGLPILEKLITAATEYQMCKEHEKTERFKIEAQLEACLTAINKNHEAFLHEMNDNQSLAMRAYDVVEQSLSKPEIITNPNLFQSVLLFLQNVHAEHSKNFVTAVNKNAPKNLPRIG